MPSFQGGAVGETYFGDGVGATGVIQAQGENQFIYGQPKGSSPFICNTSLSRSNSGVRAEHDSMKASNDLCSERPPVIATQAER